MKKLILFSSILLQSFSFLFGQNDVRHTYSKVLTYDPSDYKKDGLRLKIKVVGALDAFFDEPTESHTATVEILRNEVYIDGKWYDSSLFDEEDLDKVYTGIVNFKFDIYDGSYWVSTKKIHNAVSVDFPGSPSWDEIFPNVSEERAKSLFKRRFQMRNFELYDVTRIQNGIGALRNHIHRLNDIESYLRKAREYEQENSLDEALEQYKSALALDPQNDELSIKIKALKTKIYERNVATEYQMHIDKALEFERSGDIKQAVGQYKMALEVKPDDALASNKIVDLEENIENFTRNIEAAKEAEEKGDYAEAKEFYQKASDFNPSDQEAKSGIFNTENKLKESRLKSWQEKKEKENREREQRQNQQMAAHGATIGLMSVLMFMDLGEDRPNNIYNRKKLKTQLEFGYGVSSIPVIETQRSESYNGSTTKYSQRLQNGDLLTLNVHAGLEFWPLRTSVLDIGAGLNGEYGMGVDGSVKYGFDSKGMVDFGFKGFKVLGRMYFGYISGSYYWTTVGSGVEIENFGDLSVGYNGFGCGLQISFDAWDSRSNLELLYRSSKSRSQFLWEAELASLTWWTSNRLKISFTYSWSYMRPMEFDIDYSEYDHITNDDVGNYFDIRIVRLLSYYQD